MSALFTSVPIKDAITVIKQKLETDQSWKVRTNMTVNHVIILLDLVLNTTYFTFDGDLYRQKFGAAMGSPVSPIVANLFMEDFEVKALASAVVSPKLWFRYVDDTIVAQKKSQTDNFTAHLNTQHPSIKFTMEREENGTLPMLDAKIHKNRDGTVKCTVYRKKTHTD